MNLRILPIAGAILLASGSLHAQQATMEDRLREALRRQTVELRALQDSQATLQASLDQAQQQRDQLQKQVADLTAKLGAAQAAPPRPAVDPELARLRDAVQALQTQNKAMQAGLQRWQTAYQQAAALARAKDAEGKMLAGRVQVSETKLAACETANTKLIGVANDILHLYHTQDFRALLLNSYEPLLGLKKVQLQNTIQDYEDRILDQKFYPDQVPQSAPAAPARTKTP